MIFIWILASIIIFSVIILIHEYGHFKSARIFWVKVEEFGLGIPPKAKKIFTDKHQTDYTLNWLPFGGFVRLKWEMPQDGEKPEKDSLTSKPAWQQIIIMLAWVFMNFMLAWAIFSLLFFIWVKPVGINSVIELKSEIKLLPTYNQAIEIGMISSNPWVYLSPIEWWIANIWWLQENDLILYANNIQINDYDTLKEIISSNPNTPITLSGKRFECNPLAWENCIWEDFSLEITPNIEGKIESYLIPNQEINQDFIYKYWFFSSLKYGFFETTGQIHLTFVGLKTLVQKIISPQTPTERQEAIDQVSGPIGMIDFMSKTLWEWMIFLLIIAAIISINVWVFNLLPIPALDGWRVLLISIDSILKTIFRKKILSHHIEAMIHGIFFLFLIALIIIISYNDIYKIIHS